MYLKLMKKATTLYIVLTFVVLTFVAIIATLLQTNTAFAQDTPDLNLPPNPPGVVAEVSPVSPSGEDYYLDVTLSGFESGFDVIPNVPYGAWCDDPYSGPPPYDPRNASLYSTYDSNMPADVSNIEWDKINYLLNHKQGQPNYVIQPAIWYLITGSRDTGNGFTCPVSSTCDQLVTDAISNGAGFVPGPGEIVGVLVYLNGISIVEEEDDGVQDLLIELTLPPPPAIAIEKYTNGQDADDPNGADVPVIAPGDAVQWTYDVTNVGNVDIPEADITVTDNVPGVNPVFDSVKTGDADNILEPGEVWTYSASGTALDLATASQPNLVADSCNNAEGSLPGSTAYTNLGTVTIPGDSDTDPSSYCGPLPPPPAIAIEKYTNGQDADDPNGADVPVIAPGDAVQWTYDVTNVGNVDIPEADITVTDNVPGVNPVFDSVKTGDADNILEPGEVWTYSASGTALDLTTANQPNLVADSCNNAEGSTPGSTAYTNLGTVTIPGDSDTDPSSYCGPFRHRLPSLSRSIRMDRTLTIPTAQTYQ